MTPFVVYRSIDWRSVNVKTDNEVACGIDRRESSIGSGKIAYARDQAIEWLGAAVWARKLGLYSKAVELLYIARSILEEYALPTKPEFAFPIEKLQLTGQDQERISMTARKITEELKRTHIYSPSRQVATPAFYYTDFISQPLRLAQLSAEIIQGLLVIEQGYLLIYHDRLEGAEECAHKVLIVAKEIKSRSLQHYAEYVLASVDLCKGMTSDALALYHAVADSAVAIGDLALQGDALAQEAVCQSSLDMGKQALHAAHSAVSLLSDLHALGSQAEAEVALGSILLRFEEPEKALKILSHGRDTLARLGWVRSEARALAFESLAQHKLRHTKAARATYSRYASLLPSVGAHLVDKQTERELQELARYST